MKSKIRIALATHGFPLGGITSVNLSIARRVSKAAPEFEFLIFHDKPFSNKHIDCPFRTVLVRDFPGAVKEWGIDILVECSRLEKGTDEIRRNGTRVIYADHGQAFGEQFAILDRRKGGTGLFPLKRILWHLFQKRRYDGTGRAWRMAVARTAKAYESSDVYLCLCQAYKDQIQKELGLSSDNRLRVIRNYQPIVENPRLNKEKHILYCGRLSRYDKRVDRLLRIWARVQDQLPDYCLDIVGSGREGANLKRLARRLSLKRVTFWGKRFDMDTFYNKASILCMTSQTEGWGLVLTEAQANGVIPIAFNCSAGVEEILDGGAGVLVPLADEERFAQELLTLCKTEDLRPLRERCIEKAKLFSEEENTQAWVRLFRSLSEASGKI